MYTPVSFPSTSFLSYRTCHKLGKTFPHYKGISSSCSVLLLRWSRAYEGVTHSLTEYDDPSVRQPESWGSSYNNVCVYLPFAGFYILILQHMQLLDAWRLNYDFNNIVLKMKKKRRSTPAGQLILSLVSYHYPTFNFLIIIILSPTIICSIIYRNNLHLLNKVHTLYFLLISFTIIAQT